MKTLMLWACVGLAGVGFNPQLAIEATTGRQDWTVVDLGDGAFALSYQDVSILVRDGLMLITDGEQTQIMEIVQAPDRIVLTVLDGPEVGQVVEVEYDGEIVAATAVKTGESSQWEVSSSPQGEARLQGTTEELGFFGGLALAGILGAGLLLVLCLSAYTLCVQAMSGTLPRRVLYKPFVCPAGMTCEV